MLIVMLQRQTVKMTDSWNEEGAEIPVLQDYLV